MRVVQVLRLDELVPQARERRLVDAQFLRALERARDAGVPRVVRQEVLVAGLGAHAIVVAAAVDLTGSGGGRGEVERWRGSRLRSRVAHQRRANVHVIHARLVDV